uniref:LISCH7 domain-containing protein n=2 Tax=Callorhinchus milii TaxID=7868 RepID=A0A4W3GCA3_CALMI
MLIGVCFCQCCPQCCCCYVRCICCPKRCCCPEKALLRHELFKQAKKGLFPWMDPSMYGDEERQTFMPPYHPNMPIPREYSMKHSIPLSVVPYSGYPSSSNKMLDYIEHEVKTMNASQSLQNGIHISGSSHPSILSSLDNGVREVERRVIQLPPLLQRIPESSLPSSHRTSNSSHRNNRHDERQPRNQRPQEGSRSSRSSQDRRSNRPAGSRRDNLDEGRSRLPSRSRFHGSYSDDSDYDERSRRSGSNHRRGRRGYEEDRRRERRGTSADRSTERRSGRRERSYSPPSLGRRRASWSSLDNYEHGGAHSDRRDDRMANWLESLKKPLKYHEKPPSYHSVDGASQESSARRSHNGRQSERGSSRSGKSVVI